MRRMAAATSSSPLATQTGAEPGLRDHLSATATWVGLVSATSASGTSISIRLVAMAWARRRRSDFMVGSPSDFFTSSFISWKDMRFLRAWSKRCQRKSIAPITTAMAAITDRSEMPTRIISGPTARASARTRAAIWSVSATRNRNSTVEIAVSLTADLRNSTSPVGPYLFFALEIGLMRDSLGASFSGAATMARWAA